MKTRVRTSAHKVRSELAARAEVMYLELNRGRRGVPRLYGGWRDAREDRVYYVVQRAGSPMVVDEVSNNSSAAWLAFCRADPVVCRRRPFYVVSTPSTRLLDGVCSMRAGDAMSARWTSTPSTRRPLDSLVHTRRGRRRRWSSASGPSPPPATSWKTFTARSSRWLAMMYTRSTRRRRCQTRP